MSGAIDRARELIEQTPGSWMPQQFDNPANVEIHRRTTAQEILRDFADRPLDAIDHRRRNRRPHHRGAHRCSRRSGRS